MRKFQCINTTSQKLACARTTRTTGCLSPWPGRLRPSPSLGLDDNDPCVQLLLAHIEPCSPNAPSELTSHCSGDTPSNSPTNSQPTPFTTAQQGHRVRSYDS